ncbi:unnamed protein product [Brachionus calyciflorus]|uniref:C2H2-type domain-containing protein n=1 Tax=Brachionus calyciflorus TaxID=104777 RepID=A0A814IZ61_9BILA|nr:unnamed protein product [Brachionus calyciflorus]
MDKVDLKISELIAMGCLQPDDPKFNIFKKRIVPSLVNEWITPKGVNSHSFRCPFDSCAVLVSRSQLMERHLREQHYDEIPIGVFGKIKSHNCNPCGQTFKRLEHLYKHLSGRKHLKTLISQGIATKHQRDEWDEICKAKQEHKELAKNFKLKEMVIEESLDSSSNESNASVIVCSSSSSSEGSSISSSFPELTSTPIIHNIEKRFISHEKVFQELKAHNSDDELFDDLNFLNMINELEKNGNLETKDHPQTLTIPCFQKKRKNEQSDDSLETILSTKRIAPNEESQYLLK